MKHFYHFTSVIATLIVATVFTLHPAQASSSAQTSCSLPTLQGNYRFLAPTAITVSQGTVIAIPETYFVSSPASFASAGNVTFDGKGSVALEASADRQERLANPVLYEGSYTVDANCVATVTLNNNTSFTVKSIQSGNHQQVVSLTPGFVLTP